MEKKWCVVMMMFVLLAMAAIGTEAASHLCTFQCEITCRDPEFTSNCFKQCMAACEHPPSTTTFHSTSNSQMKTKGMEEMRGYHCLYLIFATADGDKVIGETAVVLFPDSVVEKKGLGGGEDLDAAAVAATWFHSHVHMFDYIGSLFDQVLISQ